MIVHKRQLAFSMLLHMVYSGYGTDSGARSYCAYPSITEISSAEMEVLLNAATQRIQDDTAKSDWDSADNNGN